MVDNFEVTRFRLTNGRSATIGDELHNVPEEVYEPANRGDRLLREGQNQEAIEEFQLVLNLQGPAAPALTSMGVAFWNLEKLESALEVFERAISLSPDYSRAWRCKAFTLTALGHHRDSLEVFDQCLKLNPEDGHAWAGKALAFINLGRYSEAVEAFDKGLALGIDDHAVWSNKDVAHSCLGEHRAALRAFNRALKYGSPAETSYNKGVTLRELGKHEQALSAFNRALRLKPDYATAWCNKAETLWQLGRHQQALEAVEEALRYKNDFPVAWYNKAAALKHFERYREAFDAFEQAYQYMYRHGDLYKNWVITAMLYGMDGVLENNQVLFREAADRYIHILEKARGDGFDETVESAVGKFEAELERPEQREAFEDMKLLIRLLSIEDPFERWTAFTKAISDVWPRDVSAVDAIREQRY